MHIADNKGAQKPIAIGEVVALNRGGLSQMSRSVQAEDNAVAFPVNSVEVRLLFKNF